MSKSSSKTSKKSKEPVAPVSTSTPTPAAIKNTYSPRKSDKFSDLISDQDNSRLITGTSTSNAVAPVGSEEGAKSQSSLIVHQDRYALGTDLEANVNHYGIIGPDSDDINGNLVVNDGSCTGYLQSLTNTQIWVLFGIVASLVILTVILYLLGNTTQLQLIWGKIFCWLGVLDCGKKN